MSLIENQAPARPSFIPVSSVGDNGQTDNETALNIVKADIEAGESYMAEKMWVLRWREIDNLYQSPRPISMWEGTLTQEANVQAFTVAKHTNAIVPAVMNGIFYQEPFFILRPSDSLTEELVRQKTTLFSEQFREQDFENTCLDGWFYTVLFGTAIYKWGVCSSTKTKVTYRRKGQKTEVSGKFASVRLHTKASKEMEAVEEEVDHWCTEIFHIPNEEVIVDPRLEVPDIRKAKFVDHVQYMSGYDLIEMAKEHEGEDGWFMPSVELIRSWFEPPVEGAAAPSAPEANMTNSPIVTHARDRNYNIIGGDPLARVLRVDEHWTKDRVVVMVENRYCLRNGVNPWGKIPFYSSHWWRIPRSFWSMGVGHLVGGDQRVSQGLRNAALNIISMSTNPVVIRKSGSNQPGQNIRLRRGAIITVEDDVDKAFKLMEMPRVPQDAWIALQNSDSESVQNSGADEQLVQGTMSGSGKSSMGRTAAGATQLASAVASRLQGPVTRFVKNVLEPWIYQIDDLINEEMPEDQIEEVLGEKHGKEYVENKFDFEKYLNCRAKFEILAAQHLAAKRSMAQIVPLMIEVFQNQQLLTNMHQTGWTIDAHELVEMFYEISEFTNRRDVIRRMTPEEQQMAQQMNPSAGKIQGQIAVDDNRAKNQSQINAEKNDARATDIALRHALSASMEPELLTGQPGGQFESAEENA